MKIFQKKFKTKISYFGKGKYTISYTNYRFIPIWHRLYFWFEQSVTGGTECWSIELLKVNEAEKLAKSLKSIEDVKKWHDPHEKRMRNFYIRKDEYYKKSAPYNSKTF